MKSRPAGRVPEPVASTPPPPPHPSIRSRADRSRRGSAVSSSPLELVAVPRRHARSYLYDGYPSPPTGLRTAPHFANSGQPPPGRLRFAALRFGGHPPLRGPSGRDG